MFPAVFRRIIAAVIAVGLISAPLNAGSGAGKQARKQRAPLELSVLGTFSTGLGEASAEISAYDPHTRRLFVVNAAAATIDISKPSAPSRVATIDASALGSPNSVAVARGLVAVAIQAAVKTDAGVVAFYNTDGKPIATAPAGALPDMLTFTPDGSYVLVANEGEPAGYGSPELAIAGSVSIICVPRTAGEWKKFGPAMMYDVTNPYAPLFIDYLNNRDFAGTGDLGPEGLEFIAAHHSPNGRPLLVVANEISGTLTIYAVSPRQ